MKKLILGGFLALMMLGMIVPAAFAWGPGYGCPNYYGPRVMVPPDAMPPGQSTPYGILLPEGVLISWRDFYYNPYSRLNSNLPERWFRWCLEYQKNGRYPGWHPCPAGGE